MYPRNSPTPVSYTHLDVYKRQDQERLAAGQHLTVFDNLADALAALVAPALAHSFTQGEEVS